MGNLLTITKSVEKCPECGFGVIFKDETRGELVCKHCGLIVEDQLMDFSQEWREFEGEGGGGMSRRTGAPMSLSKHDKGISTEIGNGLTDIFKLKASKRGQFFRLKKWQRRINTSMERNLKYALAELKRYVSLLGLPPSIEETTALIYRKIMIEELVRGRSMEAMLSGALYAACREYITPRTLDEIHAVTKVEKREIGRAFRLISRELGMRILPTDPAEYISRFASQLKLSGAAVTKTMEILKIARGKELTSGRGPTGVAAAVLYIASQIMGERRTQRQIAEVAGVTEVTIRNRYKEFVEKLGMDALKK